LDVQFMLAELSAKDQLQPWCFFYGNDKKKYYTTILMVWATGHL
jgi:hypothetical protein